MPHQVAREPLTGQVAEALASVRLNLLLCKLAELNAVSAVDLLRNCLDLLLDGEIEVVEELEVRGPLTDCDDGLRESASACTTLSPMVADDCSVSAASQSLRADKFELGRRISPVGERSVRYDHRDPE